MPSLCVDCEKIVISAHENVYGVCSACIPNQVRAWQEWDSFMTHRFRPHRPLEGEMFEVTRQLEPQDDGRWLAVLAIGSNLVPARIYHAKVYDTELEAVQGLRAA